MDSVRPLLKSSKIVRKVAYSLFLFMFLLGNWYCSSTTTSPKAPMEEYQYLDKQIEDEKYASVLNLPVEVPVSEIEEALNQQIKGLLEAE